MENLVAILNFVGWITAIYVIVSTAILIWGIVSGFLPVLFRLGLGLWGRKIVIVANNDDLDNLEALLSESRLFKRGNILRASGRGQLETISRASVILAYWPHCKDDIDEILSRKKENSPLIFYAPHHGGHIPIEIMKRLEERKHVVVNNFRGRLMNDVVTSMITTAYEKK
jgi:hypothetical protein